MPEDEEDEFDPLEDDGLEEVETRKVRITFVADADINSTLNDLRLSLEDQIPAFADGIIAIDEDTLKVDEV